MNENGFSTPAETAETVMQGFVKRIEIKPPVRQMLLAILGGVYIAFASQGSNMAAFNLLANPETFGLGRLVAGLPFGTGLMLVILAGAEIFTGNNLLMTGVLDKKIRIGSMLLNWLFVYIGNFIGSLLIAFMMAESGLFDSGANLLGGVTIRIAAYKTNLPFLSAFYLGIMCNWLVCLAIWMANGAKDVAGKILAILFPIWLFVTSGFEHSVANMYYIPAGILAKANPAWAEASGLSADRLAALNWQTLFTKNLIPVSLGNIVGGAVFVAGIYWYTYLRKPATRKNDRNG